VALLLLALLLLTAGAVTLAVLLFRALSGLRAGGAS
jgi:hypothetical protein